MNELLVINTDEDIPTVSARDLHSFLESNERFSKWFERMVTYGFQSNIDYTPYQKVHPQNFQEITDYRLTVECGKQISMLQRNEKGVQARKYFIEVEKAWNSPEKIMARALEIANNQLSSKQLMIDAMKPKVEFFDQVASSKDAVEMGKVAKVLNIPGFGRNKLFDFLRSKGVLMKDNLPYQRYCDSRHFRVIETKFTTPTGEVKVSFKTLVYQKGLDFIRKLVEQEREGVK